MPEQELEQHRGRELRCVAEPAVLRVEVALELLDRGVDSSAVERQPTGELHRPGQGVTDPRRGLNHLAGPVPPRVVDRLEQLPEARLAVPRAVREVGAGEERAALVVENAGHRPAALAGQRDGRLHVDRVDVRALLAVHLDAHVVLVEVRRGRLVLERLVGHHVAPVAGGVPDGEQNWCITALRLGERFGSPLPPIHRILRVLEQIGARCRGETIGHSYDSS